MREESIIRRNRIKWEQYESPKLDLTKRKLFDDKEYVSCGSAALGLITGINPKTVEKSCPNPRSGWYTTRVIKYLRNKGYTVIELSKEDVLKNKWYQFSLNEKHCLLLNVRMDSEDNSMFVVHRGNMWHNYEKETDYNPLFFLNKPTQDVLLICHKKWR